MMKTNLPPQAYTREVFAHAYEWLQSQSKSIKELAQTPDDLVALYLQARRHGHLNNTQTPSSKSFKNDLKNLAEGLRQFDDTQSAAPSASAVTEKVRETTKHSFTFTNPPPAQAHFSPSPVIEKPYFTKEEFEEPFEEPAFEDIMSPPQQRPFPSTNYYHEPKMDLAPEKEKPKTPITSEWQLTSMDEKSQEIIKDVKSRLNLSRDEEAVRMLLVLGREKLNDILPIK